MVADITSPLARRLPLAISKVDAIIILSKELEPERRLFDERIFWKFI
jgi:hypothetical protein